MDGFGFQVPNKKYIITLSSLCPKIHGGTLTGIYLLRFVGQGRSSYSGHACDLIKATVTNIRYCVALVFNIHMHVNVLQKLE